MARSAGVVLFKRMICLNNTTPAGTFIEASRCRARRLIDRAKELFYRASQRSPDRVSRVSDQRLNLPNVSVSGGARPDPGRGRRGLTAGVAAADHDDVEVFFALGHGVVLVRVWGALKRISRPSLFHVKHGMIPLPLPLAGRR